MMKVLIIFIFTAMIFGQVLKCEASSVPLPSKSPSAPSRECDIRLSSWCILQGASRITLVNKVEHEYNDFWVLQGPFYKKSQLVILEPSGCRVGMSDTFKPLGFDSGIRWHGKVWDRVVVKLKKNGSCNIAMLFPLFDHDEMEWAFSSGLILVRACQDKSCSGNGPTTERLRSLYRDKFERKTTPKSVPKDP